MMYLSKGLPVNVSRRSETRISLCGTSYVLGPRLTALWNSGRSLPKPVSPGNEHRIHRMAQCGLTVRTEESAGTLASYRLLSQCILCPNPELGRRWPLLLGRDKRIWTWISRAGLRLTVCELIRLEEQRLPPRPSLLGDDHWQALVEAVYSKDLMDGGILETAMEHSSARDATVSSLLRLLRARYIFLT